MQIAFRQFDFGKGILRSPWVGLTFFQQFFKSPLLPTLLYNTIGIRLYSLLAGFPLPILLAISLNEAGSRRYKKTVQMVTYAPYFISTVVFVGMILQVLDLRSGIINVLMKLVGGQAVNFMGNSRSFWPIYVWSGIWQGTGHSAIIYLAALAGIDPTLHEAAIVDGATKPERIRHIDLPGITRTIVILLILSAGSVMNVGFEEFFLMQNPLNQSSSEVIATYVYKVGLVSGSYSFSTGVGLFNSVVSFVILVAVNFVARRVGETSLW